MGLSGAFVTCKWLTTVIAVMRQLLTFCFYPPSAPAPPSPPPPAAAARAGGAVGSGAGAKAGSTSGGSIAQTTGRMDPGAGGAGAVAGGRAGPPSGDAVITGRMGSSAGVATPPRDGQGRQPKFRKAATMTQSYAVPATPAEQQLAANAMGLVKARGVRGEDVWEAAAEEYNKSMTNALVHMRDTQQPTSVTLGWHPIDRALFKRYWQGLSSATTLQRAGVPGAMFPHPISATVGAKGAGAGVRAGAGAVAGLGAFAGAISGVSGAGSGAGAGAGAGVMSGAGAGAGAFAMSGGSGVVSGAGAGTGAFAEDMSGGGRAGVVAGAGASWAGTFAGVMPGGGGGAGARVGAGAVGSVEASKLTVGQLNSLSGNGLRSACRDRKIKCGNHIQPQELKRRLIVAGWVVPEEGGVEAGQNP